MDTIHKSMLRAFAEFFPNAQKIDLDSETSRQKDGSFEEILSVTLFGIGPKGTVTVVANSQEELCAKMLALSASMQCSEPSYYGCSRN